MTRLAPTNSSSISSISPKVIVALALQLDEITVEKFVSHFYELINNQLREVVNFRKIDNHPAH